MRTIKSGVITKKGNYFVVELPARRIVCEFCDGEGTELRSSLKGCVISDENLEDEDFRRSYFGGEFDVSCSHCKGRRVLDVPDTDKMTVKMAERYWRAVDDVMRSQAENEAEQRYFARARGEY